MNSLVLKLGISRAPQAISHCFITCCTLGVSVYVSDTECVCQTW